jgi:hypothetical protein
VSCDPVECALEGFSGACCETLKTLLPHHPTGFSGLEAYDLSGVDLGDAVQGTRFYPRRIKRH